MTSILVLFLTIVLLFGAKQAIAALQSPPVQLALPYQGQAIESYLASEKLDGVRAYWNGNQLLTRSGRIILAPPWFIAQLPAYPLDGELWISRGQFDQVSAIIRTQTTNDLDWQQVKYMLFDLPDVAKPFLQRYQQLQQLVTHLNQPHIKLVEQTPITDENLQVQLQLLTDQGAEGLMLRHQNSQYQAGRTQDLLKVKVWLDDEAEVIKILPGKGRLIGKMGALVVSWNGRQFKLGSGFSDQERENPPEPGTLVTFKYSGLSKNRLPRFASFLRIKPKD